MISRKEEIEQLEYKQLTKEMEADLRLPNEPFDLFGRMIVNRVNEKWSYETELFEIKDTMVFPDENYTFEEISKQGFAIGAYDQGICVGLAIYQIQWAKFIYLHDLKINQKYRKQGIAGELIRLGLKEAKRLNYKGVYTIGQDNNLAACQFYLNQGFVIGGLNTDGYRYTNQEEKSDIYFYLS